MHRPNTENVFWTEFYLLVYRACQKGETKAKLKMGITHHKCCIAKMVFLKCTFVYSRISGFEVHNSHAKNRYQDEITKKMLKLQTEVFSWGLRADPNLQLPTKEVHLPWARPAAPSPLLDMCRCIGNISCLGAVELLWRVGPGWQPSTYPAASPPQAGQERKQEKKEQVNSWVEI